MIPFAVEQFLLMCRYPYLSPFAAVGKSDRRAVAEAMSRTGVTEFAGRLISTLSGGERQKVYIAAAFAQGEAIWLLDEPTTFLDYHRQGEIVALGQGQQRVRRDDRGSDARFQSSGARDRPRGGDEGRHGRLRRRTEGNYETRRAAANLRRLARVGQHTAKHIPMIVPS